jgi:cell division protein FtsL
LKTSTNIANKRKPRGTRLSLLNVILLLFILASAIVFYTNNTIAISRLLVEISALKKENEKIVNSNAFLAKSVDGLSSLERIGQIASQRLGMIYPKRRPIALEVEKAK